MELGVQLYTLLLKGYLKYEYNPFHNYQTNTDLYKIATDVGDILVPSGCAVNSKNGEILNDIGNDKWIDKRGNTYDDNDPKILKITANSDKYATAGSVIDFETDKLNFDLEHPVEIEVLPSYDGSVNLILNDDKNIPRIINSRFSVREKNTYEIVDRIGENDTNIYNSETFDKDTSLYFLYESNPKIEYLGLVKGNLPVGQYCFYFTYCDADDNESDYIAESGLIPAFIGTDTSANSMDGGIKNQNSNKGIYLKLTNLDKSYNYIKVYYVRYFADYQLNRVYELKKIYKRYSINSSRLYLLVTGNEEAEDLDINLLNISRFNPKNVLTQAQCKNMLFFGNIVKNSDDYRELLDCALRISPSLIVNTLENVDEDYVGTGYYSSINMYNNVGYFNDEFYRFGIVFIYLNGTLSNVYNVLGGDISSDVSPTITEDLWVLHNEGVVKRNYIKIDENGWVKLSNDSNYTGTNLNARGVCKINKSFLNDEILGIKFNIPDEVQLHLKNNLGIRGFFFVRQKRIPNVIALCYIIPFDELLEAPILLTGENDYYTECFVDEERVVTNNYLTRLYKYTKVGNTESLVNNLCYAGICPDFMLNQPYFNQILNGGNYKIKKITNQTYPIKSDRIYTVPDYTFVNDSLLLKVKICTVTEDVPTVALSDKVFKLEIGLAEEAFRFRYAEIDNGTYDLGENNIEENVNKANNIVRGKYSPYLAIYTTLKLETCCLYNIYSDSNLSITQEYQNRMDSSDAFYAISDRYNFEEIINLNLSCWRGDCYINLFTYRLNRNFNDPSLPNNDLIIDKDTWKDNYDITDLTKWEDISRSDINAVQIGSWITFKIRSPYNYALRSVDHSYVAEENLMGSPRSFFPRSRLLHRGENKMPDSYLYNDAYRATLGYKCYFTLLDVNYIKNTFSNRILYSAIAIQDSFKNNYRYSLSTYFRDYSSEYGGITRLIGFEGYLLVVFEHAIGVAVVNERVLAGNGDGEPVFINTQNVLPEELTIITDTYGTQWGESVVKSEAGFVYGVDTIAKKIWRVKGLQIEILSDFKVNEFLNKNITLSENELYPVIGLKNIKTHYNNNKKDIIFTFYDNVYKDEEKVWSLCYNELLSEFITFYSWLPSYSTNIDTQFFSFDRNTSKLLTLLGKCNYNDPDNTGVLLDVPLLGNDNKLNLKYIIKLKLPYTIIGNLENIIINLTEHYSNFELECNFLIEKDHWGNYKYFNNGVLQVNSNNEAKFRKLLEAQKGILILYVTPKIQLLETLDIDLAGITTLFKTECIAVSKKEWLEEYCTTDFYLHGKSGIINCQENLYPTYWYGEIHPFEFEFVVNDKIAQLKIFTNLVIISNKAEPESFHFEVEGDNYEFSLDKRTMYFRQEATKELFLNHGSDMLFDRYYTDVAADKYTQEQYYRTGLNYTVLRTRPNGTTHSVSYADKVYPEYNKGLTLLIKSTIFPLYYERVDKYNDIYHSYTEMKDNKGVYDFKNLSGSEIVWNRKANQFNVVTHIKNSPIDLVGRLRGNSRYKEGKWNIQIPSIIFNLKNEYKATSEGLVSTWLKGNRNYYIPPIVVNSQNIPEDLNEISPDKIPNICDKNGKYDRRRWIGYIDNHDWTYRKETKIRDKWIKIRVRYSGKNLAIIHSLVTLYNISYS